MLPERWDLRSRQVHPTERYYALRPEHLESAFYLHQVHIRDRCYWCHM